MNKPLPLTTASPLARNPQPGPAHLDLLRIAQDATPLVIETWRALKFRKWLILAIAALGTSVAVLVALQMKPVYESSALMLFDQDRKSVVSIQEVYSGVGGNREGSTTQSEFLKSRDVSIRVIRNLGLTTHPEFDPRGSTGFSVSGMLVSLGLIEPRPELSDEQVEGIVLERFRRQLSIEPIRLSQLVKVSFEANDRHLAAAVANGVAAAFIEADLDARFAVTQQANEWLNTRLADLKVKLDTAESALQTYRERQGLVDTKAVAQGGTGKQLEELNQRLVEARVRRTQAQQVYNQVRPGAPSRFQVPAVINHPSVQRARATEAEAERRFAEAEQRVGSAHPLFRTAESELRSARATSQREIESVIASIQKEFEAARAAEVSLEQTLARARGEVQEINRKEIQQGALEREVEVNRQLYQMFLSRHRETTAAADVNTSPARVIDPAVPSLDPVRPRTAVIGLGALLASLGVGALLTIFWQRLDNTVKRADDLEQRLGYPLLSAVPKLAGREAAQAHMMMLAAPTSPYAESIRTISSGIQLVALDSPKKIIMVTSSVPGEGKSTVSANLAVMQARLRRTLLIDADLRRPMQAKRMGLSRGLPGLAEYVSGAKPLSECVHQLGDSKLWLMPAGQRLPNAMELFSTESFRESLHALQRDFDQIVLDCPPVRPVSDAAILGRLCTGVVFVVAANQTPAPLVRLALKRLGETGARIFGVVLNQYDVKHAEAYYGDYASYSDYTAEGEHRSEGTAA
jgi:capsular exopolysaccharide synthesis family protein